MKNEPMNELVMIYNEHMDVSNRAIRKKRIIDDGFKIIGAKVGGAEPGDLNTHCGQRHSFASEEGSYIYLKLESHDSIKKFVKRWNSKHKVDIHIDGKYSYDQFTSELITQADNNRIAYLKIHAEDGFSSLYGQPLYIMVSVGNRKESKDLYIVTISKFKPEKLNLSFFSSKFTIAPEHDNKYLSFKQGEKRTVGIECLCLDFWKEEYDEIFLSLEYEIIITDKEGNIVFSNISNLLRYTYNYPVSLPEHLVVKDFITDISDYEIGKYKCAIYFMGKAQLEMDLVILENENFESCTSKENKQKNKNIDNNTASTAIKELENLIGLENIKKDIKTHLNYVQLMKAREMAGLKHSKRILNMIFSGAPGTGKTTVCRLLGTLLKDIGIISSGHVVETNREDLLGQYIGESEKRTKALIDRAKGGILFIDEAYSLMGRGDGDRDFGRNVIDTLMTYLSEPNNDLIVVLAGYSKEMSKLLNTNPGLASRFPIRYEFPNYSAKELLQIAKLYFETYDFNITEEACERMLHLFEEAVNIPNFGNGRYVKTLIENSIIPNMANRIAMSETSINDITTLSQIILDDVPEKNTLQTKQEEKRRIGFNINR